MLVYALMSAVLHKNSSKNTSIDAMKDIIHVSRLALVVPLVVRAC